MIKVGDNVIPYNDSFRFFMTTKLSNPHYAPEVQVCISVLAQYYLSTTSVLPQY